MGKSDPDGTVWQHGDVDIQGEREDAVAKRKDSIYLFNKH